MTALRRALVAAPPMLWLGLFFLLPFLIVLKISLSHAALAVPPYAPHWRGLEGWRDFVAALSLENYKTLAEDGLYLTAYLSSLRLALTATALSLLIGFPLAYAIARAPARWRPLRWCCRSGPRSSSASMRGSPSCGPKACSTRSSWRSASHRRR
jgi:putrescine transport system permease protein